MYWQIDEINSEERNRKDTVGLLYFLFLASLEIRGCMSEYELELTFQIKKQFQSGRPSEDREGHIFKTGFVRLRDLELIESFSNQSAERERENIGALASDAFLVKDNEWYIIVENILREGARAPFVRVPFFADGILSLPARRGNYSASPSSWLAGHFQLLPGLPHRLCPNNKESVTRTNKHCPCVLSGYRVTLAFLSRFTASRSHRSIR